MIIKRFHEEILKEYIKHAGAVLVSGPKFCGKTFLAEQVCKSCYFIPEKNAKELVTYNIETILNGEKPRLIDEWQEYPKIWDFVKYAVDRGDNGNKRGLYVLTGSTKPLGTSVSLHSGAGRILTMRMNTLTFAEILDLDENSSISLQKLASDPKEFKFIDNPCSIEQVNEYLLMGGWPELHANNDTKYKYLVDGYINSIITSDAKKIGSRIDKTKFHNFLKSVARLSTTQINKSTIVRDVFEDTPTKNSKVDKNKQEQMNIKTVNKCLDMLYDIDVIFNVPCWRKRNIRSRYKTRTKPKVYFCDTSLSCRLLEISSKDNLLNDFNTTGIIFENQVMKDLSVYAQLLEGELFFYRDEKDNEIDAIIEFENGTWWAIEIKLSEEEAIKSSNKLNDLTRLFTINGEHQEPSLKLVITNSKSAIKLINDVYVIPHTLIRPK